MPSILHNVVFENWSLQFSPACDVEAAQVDFAFLCPLSCPGRVRTKKRTKEKKSAANGQART